MLPVLRQVCTRTAGHVHSERWHTNSIRSRHAVTLPRSHFSFLSRVLFQVHFVTYEELANPCTADESIRDICRFLGVDDSVAPPALSVTVKQVSCRFMFQFILRCQLKSLVVNDDEVQQIFYAVELTGHILRVCHDLSTAEFSTTIQRRHSELLRAEGGLSLAPKDAPFVRWDMKVMVQAHGFEI